MKSISGTARLIEQKPGGMCQYKIRLSNRDEVDQELIRWLRTAYESAK